MFPAGFASKKQKMKNAWEQHIHVICLDAKYADPLSNAYELLVSGYRQIHLSDACSLIGINVECFATKEPSQRIS